MGERMTAMEAQRGQPQDVVVERRTVKLHNDMCHLASRLEEIRSQLWNTEQDLLGQASQPPDCETATKQEDTGKLYELQFVVDQCLETINDIDKSTHNLQGM